MTLTQELFLWVGLRFTKVIFQHDKSTLSKYSIHFPNINTEVSYRLLMCAAIVVCCKTTASSRSQGLLNLPCVYKQDFAWPSNLLILVGKFKVQMLACYHLLLSAKEKRQTQLTCCCSWHQRKSLSFIGKLIGCTKI